MRTRIQNISHDQRALWAGVVFGGLRGYLLASFETLVALFGEPRGPSSDGKVAHEWILQIDGDLVTIYDYKGSATEDDSLHRWHVGGTTTAHLSLGQILPVEEV